MVLVVMGVSGSGKTTVGALLARRLGLPFHDADDFHSDENKAKMRRGEPLTDADRAPWLATLAARIRDWDAGGGAVLACSALREAYRQTLGGGSADVRFVYLKGARATLLARLRDRRGHYMPATLLDSQLATLEEPTAAITVSIDLGPERMVEEVLAQLAAPREHRA
jgi:carbohydrate kinase (thermoresistant glucokinase family)